MTLYYEDLTEDYYQFEYLENKEVWAEHSCAIGHQRRIYEVSSLGRRRTTSVKTKKIINCDYGSTGTTYCKFGSLGKAHSPLAQIFIPNPELKKTVNHIDGNKHNNNINNLERATYSENSQHAYDTGLNRVSEERKQHLRKSMLGENNPFFGRTHSEEGLRRLRDARLGKVASNKDLKIYKFYNYETDSSVEGLLSDLMTNAKEIFGFSSSKLYRLKQGQYRSSDNWIYLGII